MTLSTSPANLGGNAVSLITAINGVNAVAPAHVIVNSSGTEVGTTANPLTVTVTNPSTGGSGGTANSVTLLAGTASVGAVTQAGGPWSVSWTGQTVGATQNGTWSVGVTGSVAVTGAFFQATQPVSAASLPLPVGAATAAKQPALGVAGTAATDVLSIQGIAGGTPLSVTVTNPSSGGGGGSSAPTASELHLGEFGGNVARFQSQFGPTASTQYSAGQVMAAPIEITNAGRVAGGTGMMMGASIVLNVANTNPIDFVFFNALPSGTYTAGSTFTLAAGDVSKVSKAFHLTDWTPLGAAITLGEAIPSGKFYGCADATKTQSLWVVPIARGNITLAAATDATLTIRMSRN